MADKNFVVKNGIDVAANVNVGSNLTINTSTYFIGNTSQNVSINSTGFYVNGNIFQSGGGGFYMGNRGDQGTFVLNGKDLFRVNQDTQTNNITFTANMNATVTGPYTVNTDVTLTIGDGARVVVI